MWCDARLPVRAVVGDVIDGLCRTHVSRLRTFILTGLFRFPTVILTALISPCLSSNRVPRIYYRARYLLYKLHST